MTDTPDEEKGIFTAWGTLEKLLYKEKNCHLKLVVNNPPKKQIWGIRPL